MIFLLALQAAAVPPVDKNLRRQLQAFARAIKPQKFADSELVGAVVEGRDVIIRFVLSPAANSTEMRSELERTGGFASGFCKPATVASMKSLNFGTELRFEQNGAVKWAQRLDEAGCRQYWRKVSAAGNTGTVSPNMSSPKFEFKGVRSGEGNSIDLFSQCDGSVEAVLNCSMADNSAAGVPVSARYTLFKTRLYRISASFDTSAYNTLKAAFTLKYGNPSSESEGKWQNKAGAVFPNQTTSWTFRSGVLILNLRGDRIDEGSFAYVDANGPPAQKPTVDF